MQFDSHKRLVPFLFFCFWLLTVFVFPQALSAARIAGDDRTVTTVPTQKTQPRTLPAAHVQEKAASPADMEQPVKAPAEAPAMKAAPPQDPLPATPSLPVQTADKPEDRKAEALPPASGQPDRTPPKPAATPQPHPAQPAREQRYVTIDFDNVDIQVFIKFVSELTGKNFVIDDKVKAKVTVISPRKIAVDDVYRVFESVLDVYGFTTIQSGDVIKIISSQLAKEKSLETRLHHEKATTDDKYVTQIVSLDYANPDEIKRVLDPLISKTSVILSYPPTGMLVITDVLSNIKRLQDIIEALDVEGVGEQISYIPLKYASATEATKSLNIIFQQRKGPFAPIKIVADDRTNALVIAATENDTIRVRELVNLMDKEIPKGTGLIRVYYLQNARAEDTAKVLTSLQQQTKAPAGGPPVTLSKSVQIVADKATNSLIITAETADYLIIEDVVKKLDISRSMVYLEALIMEVNTAKNFKLGVEWQGANAANYDGKTGAYIGGVSGDKGSYNIAQGLLAGKGLPSGLSFGVIGQMINVATVGGTMISFPNLAAFIQAYQSDSDIRILSTPQLLTLDNEEAEITVGKNVPYVTRQDTTIGSTTNYSNFEYKDVGVTLKVTPQINKEGFVRLKLDQSVTKIVTQTAESQGTSILAPTTLKRTAKTTVTVRSGDTVVIGGMIEDNSDSGTYKVPLLGDIPLLGWLFKSKSSSAERNNLFIFITPHIIQKPEDAKNIHTDKKDYMETLREGTVKATPPKKKQ
jgi:general secretion pathway protein D